MIPNDILMYSYIDALFTNYQSECLLLALDVCRCRDPWPVITWRESLNWKSLSGPSPWRSGNPLEEGEDDVEVGGLIGHRKALVTESVNQNSHVFKDGSSKYEACMGLQQVNQVLCVYVMAISFVLFVCLFCKTLNSGSTSISDSCLLLGFFPS